MKINKSIQTESFEVFILSEKMTHQKAKALFKDHGFDKFSTQKDLKKSYRSLAQKLHPDKKGGSEDLMKKLNASYEILLQGGTNKKAYSSSGTNSGKTNIKDVENYFRKKADGKSGVKEYYVRAFDGRTFRISFSALGTIYDFGEKKARIIFYCMGQR